MVNLIKISGLLLDFPKTQSHAEVLNLKISSGKCFAAIFRGYFCRLSTQHDFLSWGFNSKIRESSMILWLNLGILYIGILLANPNQQ